MGAGHKNKIFWGIKDMCRTVGLVSTKADMSSLRIDGRTSGVTVKLLDEADFSCCIVDGRPCQHATAIFPALDESAVTLGCKKHGRQVLTDEAMACADQK